MKEFVMKKIKVIGKAILVVIFVASSAQTFASHKTGKSQLTREDHLKMMKNVFILIGDNQMKAAYVIGVLTTPGMGRRWVFEELRNWIIADDPDVEKEVQLFVNQVKQQSLPGLRGSVLPGLRGAGKGQLTRWEASQDEERLGDMKMYFNLIGSNKRKAAYAFGFSMATLRGDRRVVGKLRNWIIAEHPDVNKEVQRLAEKMQQRKKTLGEKPQ